jgi:hypothetical protein
MSKWYPTLLCPIPKGHASHYDSSPNGKLSAILRMFSSGKTFTRRSLYRNLLPATDTFPGLFVDDDRLQQPSTYYRLFKRRSADKTINHKKPRIKYVLFTPDGTSIKAVNTFKRAKYLLASDSVVYRKIHRKEIPIGSYILKTEEDYADFNWEVPTINDFSPVAVKRCNECPNKTSTQGKCHCGFWSAIRDSTHSKVWWPIHDRRMHDIRKSKEEKKLLKIKVSLQSLFED